ncbi:T-complex protein 10 C-terminus [Carpediemonas membranifera]|uniref:T-complex protein 10 C-terminus n=1 Tax=Carpediemonas membranifera TaxID=201153 RepID=A0A8J6E4Z2_9EUKA|nr:T-complex protein 10 C-terminus [Carpediemonas membranifera]|eukprot:KAG9397541.1 T-complex protein 10 C-terminus [Carpediemonas membranifera]
MSGRPEPFSDALLASYRIRSVFKRYKFHILFAVAIAVLLSVAALVVFKQMGGTPSDPTFPRGMTYSEYQSHIVSYASIPAYNKTATPKVAFSVLGCKALMLKRYPYFTKPWATSSPGPVYMNTDLDTPELRTLVERDGLGIVTMSGEPSPHRRFYFMTLDLYEREPDADWYVMVDDDCVLFIDNLMNLLSDLDPHQPMYIGGASENTIAVGRHGWMAFGGGGAVLSKAAMQRLSQLGPMDCMLDHLDVFGGDEKLSMCVFDARVPFTPVAGFHQMDIKGDASGFIEGVVSQSIPISMHHFGALDQMYPHMSNSEAAVVLETSSMGSNLFRRAVGHLPLLINGSEVNVTISVVNGFRVKLWPQFDYLSKFARVEHTWSSWYRASVGSGAMESMSLRPTEPRGSYQSYTWTKEGVYEADGDLFGITGVSVREGQCGGWSVCDGVVTGSVLSIMVDWDSVTV